MVQAECNDIHCPKHGHLVTRGAKMEAVVVSDKMKKSVSVERQYSLYIPKYERYEMRTTRIIVHNPECVSAKAGDKVIVKECRPISKLKAHVIVEKFGGK